MKVHCGVKSVMTMSIYCACFSVKFPFLLSQTGQIMFYSHEKVIWALSWSLNRPSLLATYWLHCNAQLHGNNPGAARTWRESVLCFKFDQCPVLYVTLSVRRINIHGKSTWPTILLVSVNPFSGWKGCPVAILLAEDSGSSRAAMSQADKRNSWNKEMPSVFTFPQFFSPFLLSHIHISTQQTPPPPTPHPPSPRPVSKDASRGHCGAAQYRVQPPWFNGYHKAERKRVRWERMEEILLCWDGAACVVNHRINS